MPKTPEQFIETTIIPPSCSERFFPLEVAYARPLRERGVVMAGLSELRPPFEVVRPKVPFHVVIYTQAGQAEVETIESSGEMSSLTLREGDVWVCPARHTYRQQAGENWRVMWFHLADSPAWQALREENVGLRPGLSFQTLWNASQEFLAETMETRRAAFQAAHAYAEIIGVYLDRALREKIDPAQEFMLLRLNRLWQQVDANLSYNWTVEILAGQMHLSTTHFHRLVARHSDASPMEVVTRLRMRRAAEILRASDDTVEHIAYTVGYGTQVSFSKAFKRHFGFSPGAFRRAHQAAPYHAAGK